ncbi:hypothetical protein [Ruminococcus sp.]|uniref:hypothetical protein n=1 Tax=Ruminococcus sp. TaxID=41978 RepID=UPI003FD7FA48
MADIGAELLEKIRAEFQKTCKADKYIQSVLKKIEGGTAKMEEVALLSKQLGFRASQAIGAHVNAAALPDGKMYYNIADTILTGVLKDNYDIINSAVAVCQKALDNQADIHIRPQQADFPTERVQAVANAASVPDIAEEVMIRRMTAPAQNITESFYNDYVQTNVKFRSDAGLDCYIIRNDHGGCCEWCSKLAGKYHYPEDVPKDVYRRHDNCGCTVTYLNGRKAQDVWDKTKWNVSDEELERMKKAGSREPVRLVDKSGKSDIIETKKPNYARATYEIQHQCETNKVAYNKVEKLSERLSGNEIVNRLSGGDMTSGSCASLAFAYIGNKNGLDVLDFRGGSSQNTFSKVSTIKKVLELPNVKGSVVKVKKEAADTAILLKKLEHNKEYFVTAGKHAAIVRNTENGLEYLELQSSIQNGWTSFNKYGSTVATLQKRFGCRKTVDKSFGMVWEKSVIIMDVDSFVDNNDFQHILGYINTAVDKQKKGLSGSVK